MDGSVQRLPTPQVLEHVRIFDRQAVEPSRVQATMTCGNATFQSLGLKEPLQPCPQGPAALSAASAFVFAFLAAVSAAVALSVAFLAAVLAASVAVLAFFVAVFAASVAVSAAVLALLAAVAASLALSAAVFRNSKLTLTLLFRAFTPMVYNPTRVSAKGNALIFIF